MYLIYNKSKQNKRTYLHKFAHLFIPTFIICIGLSSCHENLEKRAAREAKEYTARCCPTPVINGTRTDSVTFDIDTRTYTYYCSFVDLLDNKMIVDKNRQKIHDGLRDIVLNNTGMKVYVDKGYKFTYIVRSGSNPDNVLFKDTFKK